MGVGFNCESLGLYAMEVRVEREVRESGKSVRESSG
jgi:translation elongation factor EF-4